MLWWPLPSTNFVPPHFSAAGWQDIDPKLYDVSVISMRNVSSRVQMNCMSWDAHKLLLGCRQSSKALALVISCQRNSPQKTSTPWNMQHMVFTPLLTCGTWCSPHCSLAAHGVHPTAHLQHMVFTPLLTSTCVGTLEPQAAAVHITDIQPYLFKVHHIALAPWCLCRPHYIYAITSQLLWFLAWILNGFWFGSYLVESSNPNRDIWVHFSLATL